MPRVTHGGKRRSPTKNAWPRCSNSHWKTVSVPTTGVTYALIRRPSQDVTGMMNCLGWFLILDYDCGGDRGERVQKSTAIRLYILFDRHKVGKTISANQLDNKLYN